MWMDLTAAICMDSGTDAFTPDVLYSLYIKMAAIFDVLPGWFICMLAFLFKPIVVQFKPCR